MIVLFWLLLIGGPALAVSARAPAYSATATPSGRSSLKVSVVGFDFGAP
jgi:hypothetical protein